MITVDHLMESTLVVAQQASGEVSTDWYMLYKCI